MKISIITATFNSEKNISRALNSLKNQRYKNYQSIVIDGKSSDSTVAIIKLLEIPNMTILSEPDCGIYDALNKGIRLSQGEIIGVLHSDDYFIDDFVLQDVCNIFERDSDIDAVIGNVEYFAKHNSKKVTRFYKSNKFKKWMFRFGFMPAHTATFIKKDRLNSLNGYDIFFKSASDFDLLLRLFQLSDLKYKNLNRVIVRMSEGGTSSSGWESIKRTTKEIHKSLKKNNIYSNILFLSIRIPAKFFSQKILNFLPRKKI